MLLRLGNINFKCNPHAIYPALLTADLAAAEGWYTKLLGRGPDHRPMDTLLHWELFDQGGLMLSSSEEIAGRGVMFLYVDDLAAERRRLQGLGLCSGTTLRANTRRWRRGVIPTATSSRWRRRPRGPFRRHDRAERVKSASSKKCAGRGVCQMQSSLLNGAVCQCFTSGILKG